jgi:hypothetical protein
MMMYQLCSRESRAFAPAQPGGALCVSAPDRREKEGFDVIQVPEMPA